MTFEDSWVTIRQAAEESRHELVLSGPTISKLIQKTGLDKTLFNLQNLNYLNISQTCLEEIPEEIGDLKNLITLALHSNEISKISGSIGKLVKLKLLDCSRNKLTEVPEEVKNLPQLTTMNFGSNLLQSIPSQVANIKLTVIDLSNNKFEIFPDICYAELVHLSEIYVNGNKIKEIPASLNQLQSLKVLNIENNLVAAIPGELADCNKMKELRLKGNVLTDKRLSKLVDQCRTKQILEYVRAHCPRINPLTNVDGKSKKGKKGHKLSENENTSIAVDAFAHKLKILKATGDTLHIKITKHIAIIRPYIAGCIVRNLNFTEKSFKSFIQHQTKLHEGICEKRNAATIATHDLKSIAVGDLTYTAKPPAELVIKPLMRTKTYTGAAFFQQLQTEADNLRKEKKRNVYSGVHRYLYQLEGKSLFPCLMDSSDQVISFPPIINSDITKMSVDTKAMFVEVTSATSYHVCRNVLDQFLKDMIILGLGCITESVDSREIHSLTVEQVKVVDLEGNMKLVYPSKADLNFEDSSVVILRD